jgi:hypothetical protein
MKTEDHPIGFKKYVLLSFLGYRLRLHVWPRGGGSDSRHNHRWWFISVPLVGRFIDTRYVEVDGPGDFMKIDVLDKGGVRDGERVYHADGESNLVVRKTYTRYPLVPYLCQDGAVQSYVPRGRGFHASLVVLGRLRRDKSEIWRDPNAIDVPLTPPPAETDNKCVEDLHSDSYTFLSILPGLPSA